MPKQGSGILVEVKKGNIDLALKKLKNKIKKAGLFIELDEKSHYIKPSAKKRAKKLKAMARNKNKEEV